MQGLHDRIRTLEAELTAKQGSGLSAIRRSLVDPLSQDHGLLPPNRHFVELFFHYGYPLLPVFHRISFMARLEAQSQSLLYAMYALGLRFQGATTAIDEPDHQHADEFYALSRKMVDKELENPTIATAQTLLILLIYAGSTFLFESLCCIVAFDNFETWILQTMCFRVVFLLGLNNPQVDPLALSPIDSEIRRRVWWHCYLFDRYSTAMSTPAPPQILDTYSHVHMPMPEAQWESIGLDLKPLPPSSLFDPLCSYYTYAISISRIMAGIGDFITKEKSSNYRHDHDYDMLERLLHSWYHGLPPQVQFPGEYFTLDWAGHEPHWFLNLIHMMYHCSFILLNKSRMICTLSEKPKLIRECKHFNIIYASARSMAQICRIVKAQNPYFLYLSRFTIWCRYQAGLIFQILIQSQVLEATESVVVRSDLQEIIQTFIRESRHSPITKLFVNKLQGKIERSSIGYYTS